MSKDKKGIFPGEVFDELADEAIEDLCKTGLGHEEIYRILMESLGPQVAERYLEKSHQCIRQACKGADRCCT